MNESYSNISLLFATVLGGVLAGCATPRMEPPPGGAPLITLAAHGVQTYECRAAAGATPAWAFVGPEADLFDPGGLRIGRHGAGPSWQHEDGSGFTGTVRSRMESPRPGAIPWLLLDARGNGRPGSFANVSAVQRINTVGGVAPEGGCSPRTLGTKVHMAYRADYVLYVPAPVGSAPARVDVAGGGGFQ